MTSQPPVFHLVPWLMLKSAVQQVAPPECHMSANLAGRFTCRV